MYKWFFNDFCHAIQILRFLWETKIKLEMNVRIVLNWKKTIISSLQDTVFHSWFCHNSWARHGENLSIIMEGCQWFMDEKPWCNECSCIKSFCIYSFCIYHFVYICSTLVKKIRYDYSHSILTVSNKHFEPRDFRILGFMNICVWYLLPH